MGVFKKYAHHTGGKASQNPSVKSGPPSMVHVLKDAWNAISSHVIEHGDQDALIMSMDRTLQKSSNRNFDDSNERQIRSRKLRRKSYC